MSINNKSFENEYKFLHRVITICFENSYYLTHNECDKISKFLYPCENEVDYNFSSSQLEKIEELKQLLEKNKIIIPKWYRNYF